MYFLDDSVSIPSFCDDVDNAVAALAVAQRAPSWSISSTGSQGSTKSQPRSRSETMSAGYFYIFTFNLKINIFLIRISDFLFILFISHLDLLVLCKTYLAS